MKIINLSDLDPSWCWLKDEFQNSNLEWLHYSSKAVKLPKTLPKRDSIARVIAAIRAVNEARKGQSVLVSHGPRPALYAGSFAKLMCPNVPHLVYSFNFTDLPHGVQRRLMTKAFQQANRFVTYSTLERKLYADYLNIPIESIDMLHWAVHPPKVDLSESPIETGSYICALGSQGRDYKTLFEAMRKLPHIKLVVVASKDSIQHLSIPNNVKVYSNIPLDQAHNILAHSQFMVIPLRDSQVPCGQVTVVSGMFFKKAMIVTDSRGIHDYIQNDETGILCQPKDAMDLSGKIEQLRSSPIKVEKLSQKAYQFAVAHCTERKIVDYFTHFLNSILNPCL